MKIGTETLIKAMRALANEIQSPDGIANAAISDAANRLEELLADVERLRVEVEALEPYRDNHHDFMQHMARHDAAVIERFARDLGVFDPEYDDQGYIEVPRYAIKDYINKLRQQAKEANDFAESEIKRFQENQRAKESQ